MVHKDAISEELGITSKLLTVLCVSLANTIQFGPSALEEQLSHYPNKDNIFLEQRMEQPGKVLFST